MILTIPKVLQEKLGNDATDALSHVFNDIETNLKFELATRSDLLVTKAELKEFVSETKAELLKWLFIFWATQGAAIIALFFKK